MRILGSIDSLIHFYIILSISIRVLEAKMQKSSEQCSSYNSGNNGPKLGRNVVNECTSVMYVVVLLNFSFARISVKSAPHILVIGLIRIYFIFICYYSGYCIEIQNSITYTTLQFISTTKKNLKKSSDFYQTFLPLRNRDMAENDIYR